MKTYRVTWEIDVDANSPREAAERAQAIQHNPESTGTVFKVNKLGISSSAEEIDLLNPPTSGPTPIEMVAKFPHLCLGEVMTRLLADMACPNCGERGEIRVTGAMNGYLEDHAVDHFHSDFEYSDYSRCVCAACDHDRQLPVIVQKVS